MKYKVNIEELLSRIVEVEADNEEDAENKVRAMYNNEEIVLNADDLSSVEHLYSKLKKASKTTFTLVMKVGEKNILGFKY